MYEEKESMSNLAKSKPEQLSKEVQRLRDLCYRDTQEILKDKNDLTENNILLSCDNCLQQILQDLNIKCEDEGDDKNILDRIHFKLQTFENEVLGTQSMSRETTTIEFLIDHCNLVRTRMEASSSCNIF